LDLYDHTSARTRSAILFHSFESFLKLGLLQYTVFVPVMLLENLIDFFFMFDIVTTLGYGFYGRCARIKGPSR